MLGCDRITALTDTNQRATVMNALYQPTVDEILAGHPWNCATFRTGLVQLASAPAFEYTYQYALPTDPYCLRVLETDLDTSEPWRIETTTTGQRALLTDVSTVNIRYLGRVSDPNVYHPMLRAAIEYTLAAKAAIALTGSVQRAALNEQIAQARLAKAKAIDGQESSRIDTTTTALTEVR